MRRAWRANPPISGWCRLPSSSEITTSGRMTSCSAKRRERRRVGQQDRGVQHDGPAVRSPASSPATAVVARRRERGREGVRGAVRLGHEAAPADAHLGARGPHPPMPARVGCRPAWCADAAPLGAALLGPRVAGKAPATYQTLTANCQVVLDADGIEIATCSRSGQAGRVGELRTHRRPTCRPPAPSGPPGSLSRPGSSAASGHAALLRDDGRPLLPRRRLGRVSGAISSAYAALA